MTDRLREKKNQQEKEVNSSVFYQINRTVTKNDTTMKDGSEMTPKVEDAKLSSYGVRVIALWDYQAGKLALF